MFKCIYRRHLTLIELMVVMAIISLIAGVIGINISKSVQEQRFRTEVSQVLDKLRLAQNFMLISDEDVKVHFKDVEGGIKFWLSFQCPARSGWDREMTRESPLLTAIRRIEFDGLGEENARGQLTLNFLSGGMVMSRGVMKLSTGEGRSFNDQRYICLHGFPTPISSGSSLDQSCFKNDIAHSNDQMTQFMMPDIISKIQTQKKSNSNSAGDANDNDHTPEQKDDPKKANNKLIKPASIKDE